MKREAEPVKHVLFGAEDVAPGKMRAVEVDGIPIVVVREANGQFHALRNSCPHRGAAVSGGFLMQKVVCSSSRDYKLDESTLVVRCPWHNYEYDVETGNCMVEGDRGLKVYSVAVENGQVVLSR